MKNILYTIILSFLLLSCDLTVTTTDFQAGMEAYKAGDYATALKEWKPLAEQGDAAAQNALGYMYNNGFGVTQDFKEAAKWYRLAAEQGHAQAQFNLGGLYFFGQGVTQDYKEAAKWFRLAGEQGDAKAQDNLAVMYYKGQGVGQNIVIAYMWFYVAAENGNPRNRNLNALAKGMKPKQIAKAEKLARKCIKKNYKDCG